MRKTLSTIFLIVGACLLAVPAVWVVLNPVMVPFAISFVTWMGVALAMIGGLMKWNPTK